MSVVRTRTLFVVSALLAALLGLAATALPAASAASNISAQRKLEATARAATARYHDVAAAVADGYEPVSPCTEAPGLGVMGIHYLNHMLVDDVVDAGKPEVLLYLPDASGALRLIGVEYFVPSHDQDDSDGLDDHDRPVLGAVPFDGPMAGHGPGEPFHYDLHVWVWARNPAGMYAPWNPALSCPAAPASDHRH